MTRLKVYGGRWYGPPAPPSGARVIIAASSKREVKALTQIGRAEVRDFWTETGNPVQVTAAMAWPRVLLIEAARGRYVPLDS